MLAFCDEDEDPSQGAASRGGELRVRLALRSRSMVGIVFGC